jgi:hypothetical protein
MLLNYMKQKGGTIPKLSTKIKHIQIKPITFTEMDNDKEGLSSILNTYLSQDKELRKLKLQIEQDIQNSKYGNKSAILNGVNKILPSEHRNIFEDNGEFNKLMSKSVKIITKDLYKFDEEFRNDVDGLKKSGKNIFENLNSDNKQKIKNYIKIIFHKIIFILNDGDRIKFNNMISNKYSLNSNLLSKTNKRADRIFNYFVSKKFIVNPYL